MIYLFYKTDGKISGFYEGPSIELQNNSYPYVISETSIDTKLNYVLDKKITKRPINIVTIDKQTLIADGIDSITFSNVVKGVLKAINIDTGETVSGEIDGTDTFSTTITGTYKIKIESFPYLDFEATIEAI